MMALSAVNATDHKNAWNNKRRFMLAPSRLNLPSSETDR
jgi:hypothetical protein